MTTGGAYFPGCRLSRTKNLPVSDAGCPKSPVEAACSENDDSPDLVSVHLHLQGPHPVPPQLQAHMSTRVCPAQLHPPTYTVITDDCRMEFAPFSLCQTALS